MTVNGERAQYFGPGESYDSSGTGTLQNNLSSDFFFKWLNSPALVRTTLNRQPSEIKDLASGYAAGVNHYLKERSKLSEFEFTIPPLKAAADDETSADWFAYTVQGCSEPSLKHFK